MDERQHESFFETQIQIFLPKELTSISPSFEKTSEPASLHSQVSLGLSETPSESHYASGTDYE